MGWVNAASKLLGTGESTGLLVLINECRSHRQLSGYWSMPITPTAGAPCAPELLWDWTVSAQEIDHHLSGPAVPTVSQLACQLGPLL